MYVSDYKTFLPFFMNDYGYIRFCENVGLNHLSEHSLMEKKTKREVWPLKESQSERKDETSNHLARGSGVL